MKKHIHKPKTFITRYFAGPVERDKPNPRAHGWKTVKQVCACGAWRSVNVNQQQDEPGYWQEV